MAWGNPEPAKAEPVAIICDHPQCSAQASLVMQFESGEKVNACVAHVESDMRIVGILPKAEIVEPIIKRLIAQHEEAKAVLEAAKNSELMARNLVGDYAFPVEGRKEGMNNLPLADGRIVKLTHKVNYSLDGDNEAIEKAEDEAAAAGNEGAFLAERIITWKAEFSKSEYNKLQADNPTHMKVKAAIDKVLKTSNGTPSLEVKEPKATLNG